MMTRSGVRFLVAAFAIASVCLGGLGPVSAQDRMARDPADWRQVDPENVLQLTINNRQVLIELAPQFAPQHVERVREVTRAGHYDGIPFHRVIDDFMAQGGEVGAVYMLASPYGPLKAEFTFRRSPKATPALWVQAAEGPPVGYIDGFLVSGQPDGLADMTSDNRVEGWALHCPGVASMARTDVPDSADTQYFLVRQPSHNLDQKYTVWGRALIGLDVIREIKAGDKASNGAVTRPDKVTKAMIAADIPEAQRPRLFVQRTDGPLFLKTIEALAERPAESCDYPSPQVVLEQAGS